MVTYTTGMIVVLRIRFLTSTPLDIHRGSGTYVGMYVLTRALTAKGHQVKFETPHVRFPIYTLERLWFNRTLRASTECDVTVGFDMDGYRIAGSGAHVAALKGVNADEVRFERGFTRRTMALQARCEALHVQRARRVLTTSVYAARQAQTLYGLAELPAVVPELIDLPEWRGLLEQNPAQRDGFTVLFVGRHYRRKRIDVLLRAAARLRIPGLAVRIVGSGPCTPALQSLSRRLQLDGTVTWLGDVPRPVLAAEYNGADVFCLPSMQEGFGIVLLEAMAAGKPIIASNAAAIPEVAPHATLVTPDSADALAAGIEELYGSRERRESQTAAGLKWVEQFDAPVVAEKFLEATAPFGRGTP